MYRLFKTVIVNNAARRKRLHGLIGGTNRHGGTGAAFTRIVPNMEPRTSNDHFSFFLFTWSAEPRRVRKNCRFNTERTILLKYLKIQLDTDLKIILLNHQN